MDATDFFFNWKAARLVNTKLKPIGASGLQQTELIWRKWLLYCASDVARVTWVEAKTKHIEGFCRTILPHSKIGKPSPVTLRRYWRVLFDLYAHAGTIGVVLVNPADGAKPEETERVDSLALHSNMWIALREGLPSGHTFKDRRNRLVLLLMMRVALTVSEIIGLTVGSAKPYLGTPEDESRALEDVGLPLLQPESSHWQVREPFPIYLLNVENPRTGKTRCLLLDARTSKALHDWLEVRKIGEAQIEPASRLILGDKVGTSIAPKGLYNICKIHIEQCLTAKGVIGLPAPNTVLDEGTLAHLGPNTLRNTCIALWFNNKVPLEEIKRRCGFKDASVMSRLQKHISNPFPIDVTA